MLKMIKISERYTIVWFPGERFSSFEEVDLRLTTEGFGLGNRTVINDLVNEIVPRYKEIEEKYEGGNAIIWVFCSDSKLYQVVDDWWCLPCAFMSQNWIDNLFPPPVLLKEPWRCNNDGRRVGYLIRI